MVNQSKLKIATINHHEKQSGAAFIARTLFEGFREKGHLSKYFVQYKSSEDPDVFVFDDLNNAGQLREKLKKALLIIPAANNSSFQKIERKFIHSVLDPKEAIAYLMGRESTHFRQPARFLNQYNVQFDILNLHNVHGGYFGIELLPELSRRYPVIITMHDTWLLSGHCAYSIECDRWKTSCGQCPDLNRYPPLRRDATKRNWKHKSEIFKRSRIYPVGVSKWVLDQANQSMLLPAIQLPRVIYNGIDLSIFKPGNRISARKTLGLPENRKIVLFIANSLSRNVYKDYETFQKTFEYVGREWKGSESVVFLGLGGDTAYKRTMNNTELSIIEKIQDSALVASYYQAANIYLHTTRADTFPTTILEAMACGLPVIATNVGGIPEQVIDGFTGYLANFQDSIDHGRKVLSLLENPELSKSMGAEAAQIASVKYCKERMVSEYLTYYEEVLDDWQRHTH